MRFTVRAIGTQTQGPCMYDGIKQPLSAPLVSAETYTAAKDAAEQIGHEYYYGVAIVDAETGTVDWGDVTTPMVSESHGSVILADTALGDPKA